MSPVFKLHFRAPVHEQAELLYCFLIPLSKNPDSSIPTGSRNKLCEVHRHLLLLAPKQSANPNLANWCPNERAYSSVSFCDGSCTIPTWELVSILKDPTRTSCRSLTSSISICSFTCWTQVDRNPQHFSQVFHYLCIPSFNQHVDLYCSSTDISVSGKRKLGTEAENQWNGCENDGGHVDAHHDSHRASHEAVPCTNVSTGAG